MFLEDMFVWTWLSMWLFCSYSCRGFVTEFGVLVWLKLQARWMGVIMGGNGRMPHTMETFQREMGGRSDETKGVIVVEN